MRRLGRGVLFVALLASAWPARAADPMLMFLLSVAREIITNAIASQPAQTVAPEPVLTYPGTAVEPAHLRRLIDDSFFYLSQLSYREKQLLAEEFRRETAAIPGDERAHLHEILERRLLPVPSDLNQLLLAALEPSPDAPR